MNVRCPPCPTRGSWSINQQSRQRPGLATINFDLIAWDDEDDSRGNVRHLAANGLTIDEVEQVLHDPDNRPIASRSTGRPMVIGTTTSGMNILVVIEIFETKPVIVVRPVTAYEPVSE